MALEDFPAKLAELREAQRWSVAEVVRRSKIASESTYSRWEAGTSEPSISQTVELAEFWNVPLSYFWVNPDLESAEPVKLSGDERSILDLYHALGISKADALRALAHAVASTGTAADPLSTVADAWVVEYSQNQRAFNVDRLSRVVGKNLGAFLRNRRLDYLIVALAATHGDAMAISERLDSRSDRGAQFTPEELDHIINYLVANGASRFLPYWASLEEPSEVAGSGSTKGLSLADYERAWPDLVGHFKGRMHDVLLRSRPLNFERDRLLVAIPNGFDVTTGSSEHQLQSRLESFLGGRLQHPVHVVFVREYWPGDGPIAQPIPKPPPARAQESMPRDIIEQAEQDRKTRDEALSKLSLEDFQEFWPELITSSKGDFKTALGGSYPDAFEPDKGLGVIISSTFGRSGDSAFGDELRDHIQSYIEWKLKLRVPVELKSVQNVSSLPTLDLERVVAAWPDLIRRVGVRLGVPLSRSAPSSIEPPDTVVVRVPDGYDWIVDECRTGESLEKLEGTLKRVLARPVKLRFERLEHEAKKVDLTEDADPKKEIKEGSRVVHPEYGIGRVTKLQESGYGQKATVEFVLGGSRTFVVAKTPFRLLEGQVAPPKVGQVRGAWPKLIAEVVPRLRRVKPAVASILEKTEVERLEAPNIVVIELLPKEHELADYFSDPAAQATIDHELNKILDRDLTVKFVKLPEE